MRNVNYIGLGAGALLLAMVSSSAGASVIYSNEFDGIDGDCSFNTTCAVGAGRGDDFAAQHFTVDGSVTAKAGSFVTLDGGPGGTAVNWDFYSDNGAGNLPGTLIAGGTSTVAQHSGDLGGGCCGLASIRTSFDLPSVSLSAGGYYFAVQYVTPTFQNYLARGVTDSGAAETHDGGVTWSPGYQALGGVGVALYDAPISGAVPEPASWALMILGFGGIGASLRNRRRTAAATA